MRVTPVEAFHAKVSHQSGCWIWQGAVSGTGYGQFSVAGRTVKAHRFAYEEAFGPIPAGVLVCHRCDDPLCVKPSHLFLGSSADNSGDMVNKGRSFKNRGEAHGLAKLTDDQVRLMRRLALEGMPTRRIAEVFGMSRSRIGDIIRGKGWTHI